MGLFIEAFLAGFTSLPNHSFTEEMAAEDSIGVSGRIPTDDIDYVTVDENGNDIIIPSSTTLGFFAAVEFHNQKITQGHKEAVGDLITSSVKDPSLYFKEADTTLGQLGDAIKVKAPIDDIIKYIFSGNKESLVKYQDAAQGYTALHLASRHNYPELVDWLIKNGADVNILSFTKSNALHYTKVHCNSDIISMLIKARCNRDLINSQGMKAYDKNYKPPSQEEVEYAKSIMMAAGIDKGLIS